MALYRTFTGRQISLDQLSPPELQLFLEFMYRAGGPDVLEYRGSGDDASFVEGNALRLPEPAAFREAYRAACHRLLDDDSLSHALNGPLGEALEDLALRLEHRQAPEGYPWADPSNPARFLARFYRDECSSLADFSDRTGINYSHASRVLRGKAQLSLDQLREVAKRTGFAFEIVRRDAPPSPAAVTVRDYSLAAYGQRVQTLTTCLAQAGLARAVRPVLELELRARTGSVSNAPLVAERRASILADVGSPSDAAEAERGAGQTGPALCVVSLHGQEARREQLAWLFLAVEYGWFESRGYLVALVDQPLSLPSPRTRLRVDTLRVRDEPAASFVGASWQQLYMDAVHRILYALPAEWESREAPRGDPAGLSEVARLFRGVGRALLRDPLLRWHVQPVVERWCGALEWAEPRLEALDAAGGEITLRFAAPLVPEPAPVPVLAEESAGNAAEELASPSPSGAAQFLWDISAAQEGGQLEESRFKQAQERRLQEERRQGQVRASAMA